MKPGFCGRADLVRVLASVGPELLPIVARMLGYEPAETVTRKMPVTAAPVVPQPEPPRERWTLQTAPVADVPFWRLEAYEAFEAEIRVDEPTDEDFEAPRPLAPPEFQPLSSWQALLPRLRRAMAEHAERREIDVDRIVERLTAGRAIDRMPHKKRWRWGDEIQVIPDRSQHLVPYWRDQDLVYAALRRLYPRHAFQPARIYEGLREPVFLRRHPSGRRYRLPSPGSLVLVLGDLGCLKQSGEYTRRFWHDFGRRLAQNGNRLMALVPFGGERWQDDAGSHWEFVTWERSRPARSASQAAGPAPGAQAHRLLRLLAPAIRVEPELVRAARLLLAGEGFDAATESDLWQHPALIGNSCVAATLDQDDARQLRREFEHEPESLRRQVLELIRRWHAGLPPEIWIEELLSLDPASRELVAGEQEVERAGRFVAAVPRELTGSDADVATSAGTLSWVRRLCPRLTTAAWMDDLAGQAFRQMWWAAHRHDRETAAPPPGFDPRDIPTDEGPVRAFGVVQSGGSLNFVTPGRRPPAVHGSPLSEVRTRSGLIYVGTGGQRPFWKSGTPPSWAADWGEDEYGRWVEFQVGGVRQRMRWIPAGRFLMGSPDDEPERDGEGSGKWNEGPQHEVMISQGFWLFDTACTQAMWQAVMGENPSRFQGGDRPVEQVSWEDCQRFFKRINEQVPDLGLGLPTEAQWECACRADTTTPFSFGPNITPEQVNYDGNYPYAGAAKGRYRQETVPVGSLPPNSWGLFETHGNVYEWCHDGLRKYTIDSVVDPAGPTDAGAVRVIRGGGWYSDARLVRAAYRFAIPPGPRYDNIGFRGARVQAGAEPAGPEQGRQAERRPAKELPGGAELVRVGRARDVICGLPQATQFVIATDCERLELGQITRPTWASAIGRDRYGLWVEFEVPRSNGDPAAQRMRWIPPGRFLMGSPDDESGRYGQDGGEYNEGPQHQVTLTQGFWLFDTPCTQALWQAVMGKNPSRFKSPDRPVESVSWEDVTSFLKGINNHNPGLNLVLPTEAQWEYACRAGTVTATYMGNLEILGARNAPLLDGITWYGGNSGVGFDLDDGYHSKDWSEKQHSHETAGTRAVSAKRPNVWGLYDILGNVYEWCLDGLRKYTDEPVTDPVGPSGPGADRVIRGGGWSSAARYVRAADRSAIHPGYRRDYLGFRGARVQDEQAGSERAGPVSGRKGGAPTGTGPASERRRRRKRRKH